MRIKWTDDTSYTKGETRPLPRTYSADLGLFNVIVTRYIHSDPNRWYLVIDGICQFMPLKNKVIRFAKVEALRYLQERLLKVTAKLSVALTAKKEKK